MSQKKRGNRDTPTNTCIPFEICELWCAHTSGIDKWMLNIGSKFYTTWLSTVACEHQWENMHKPTLHVASLCAMDPIEQELVELLSCHRSVSCPKNVVNLQFGCMLMTRMQNYHNLLSFSYLRLHWGLTLGNTPNRWNDWDPMPGNLLSTVGWSYSICL